jgi:outer membrane protein TolC
MFGSALLTESAYYEVLAQRELERVAQDRVRRATEQLVIARARVLSGAAVQTDSLQLLLELNRARVDRLMQRATLRVARLDLGRRIGYAGEVDAAPLDSTPAPPLPITEQEALGIAMSEAPSVVGARADERAAEAAYRSARGRYLPQVDLFGQLTAFDDTFFPNGTTRSVWGITVSLPIWDQGQREMALTTAASNRDFSRALRDDAEIELRRDVIDGYQAYGTARASADLAREAVAVAAENLRVQQERYRAGATTIIDLITAQVALSEAEARMVQSRHAARLALAGIEATLGRRLFD